MPNIFLVIMGKRRKFQLFCQNTALPNNMTNKDCQIKECSRPTRSKSELFNNMSKTAEQKNVATLQQVAPQKNMVKAVWSRMNACLVHKREMNITIYNLITTCIYAQRGWSDHVLHGQREFSSRLKGPETRSDQVGGTWCCVSTCWKEWGEDTW